MRIAGNTTLADLQAIIRIAQDYDEDPLHQFRIYAKDYEIFRNQCVDRSNDLCNKVIGDFELDVGDRFVYTSFTELEIGFMKNRVYDIRIEFIETQSSRKKLPFCIGGSAMPGVRKYEYTLKKFDLLKIIFDKNDTTITVGEIRQMVNSLDNLRLNRVKVNKKLIKFHDR